MGFLVKAFISFVLGCIFIDGAVDFWYKRYKISFRENKSIPSISFSVGTMAVTSAAILLAWLYIPNK